jgi:hypothetical protein
MLGVRRTGVTAAAGALQRAGLFRYKRGNVTIIDRHGLIRRSCECYGVSKKEFDRLLGDRAIRKSSPVDRVPRSSPKQRSAMQGSSKADKAAQHPLRRQTPVKR